MPNKMNHNFNRFTIKAQEALERTQQEAASNNHNELKAVHLTLALISDDDTLVVPMLKKTKVDIEKLREELEDHLENLDKVYHSEDNSSPNSLNQLYLSQEVMKVLKMAAEISVKYKDEYVS